LIIHQKIPANAVRTATFPVRRPACTSDNNESAGFEIQWWKYRIVFSRFYNLLEICHVG